MKKLYHCLSTCMGNNSLAKSRGLSPRTGGQAMVYLLLISQRIPSGHYYPIGTDT